MIWPFRRKPTALELLRGAEWTCGSCELPHLGMFDLAAAAPDQWPHRVEYEPNSAVRLDGDFLSEDFCVIGGEDFFVRCVLGLPVRGMEESFGYGCWGSLKKENFELYVEHFDGGTMPPGTPWWSWLCNRLKPYSLGEAIGCWMFPQLDRQRPVLRVDDQTLQLARDQEFGIEAEQVFAIYAANDHATP